MSGCDPRRMLNRVEIEERSLTLKTRQYAPHDGVTISDATRLAIATNSLLQDAPAYIRVSRGRAGVAELADAPDSKSGTRESVWVRPPPPAPLK